MLADHRLRICWALLALAALPGCELVPKSRLDASQSQNRALGKRTRP